MVWKWHTDGSGYAVEKSSLTMRSKRAEGPKLEAVAFEGGNCDCQIIASLGHQIY